MAGRGQESRECLDCQLFGQFRRVGDSAPFTAKSVLQIQYKTSGQPQVPPYPTHICSLHSSAAANMTKTITPSQPPFFTKYQNPVGQKIQLQPPQLTSSICSSAKSKFNLSGHTARAAPQAQCSREMQDWQVSPRSPGVAFYSVNHHGVHTLLKSAGLPSAQLSS